MEERGVNSVGPGPPPRKKLAASFAPENRVLRKSKYEYGGDASNSEVVNESWLGGSVNAAGLLPERLATAPDGVLPSPGPLIEAP